MSVAIRLGFQEESLTKSMPQSVERITKEGKKGELFW